MATARPRRNRHIIVTISIGAITAMHGGPGARAARLIRLLPPDPRGASCLHLPVLSRPRKTHPRLLGPVKLTLATDFWRYDRWLWRRPPLPPLRHLPNRRHEASTGAIAFGDRVGKSESNGDLLSGNPIARRLGRQERKSTAFAFALLVCLSPKRRLIKDIQVF